MEDHKRLAPFLHKQPLQASSRAQGRSTGRHGGQHRVAGQDGWWTVSFSFIVSAVGMTIVPMSPPCKDRGPEAMAQVCCPAHAALETVAGAAAGSAITAAVKKLLRQRGGEQPAATANSLDLRELRSAEKADLGRLRAARFHLYNTPNVRKSWRRLRGGGW